MWKFLRSAFLAVFLCVTAAGLWCGYEAYTFLNVPPETPGQDVSFDVTPGMTISRAATALKAKNVITDPFKFRLLARYREAGGRMKVGRFLLNTGWTPDQVLNELISGKPVLTRVTIPEGLTWWQTAAILEQAGLCTAGDFADVIRDPEFLRHYGIPFDTAEGFLMPDTYLIKTPLEGETLGKKQAWSAAGRIVDNFWRRTGPLWGSPRPARDVMRNAVILASIVEKETASPGERPRVAGLYQNRMDRGMLLQADPTVIYGLGPAFSGNLTRADLSDDKNPYNTYRHPGMPPGPICSFALSALSAALHPEKHDFLYMVAITDGGAHEFTTNLTDHNRAVRRYLQNRQK